MADYALKFAPEGYKYLEHRGDGTVWCRWPDGRWLEVVPKEDLDAVRADYQRVVRAELRRVMEEKG